MGVALSKSVTTEQNPVVVVGLGHTGLSCARYLHSLGVAFAVVDSRDLPPGLADMRAEMPEVPLHLGEFPERVLAGAGRLLVSPGVSLDEPGIAAAIASGVEVAGDIDLFCEQASAPIVGITGSNAKSTVTDLLGLMLARAGRNIGVGGNLGEPALDLLRDDADGYLLELSSFQLERATALPLDLVVILNLSEDHMDRHGSLDNYRQAKLRIYDAASRAVVNRDEPSLKPSDAVSVVGSFGLDEPGPEEYGLRLVAGEEWLCRGEEPLMACAEMQLVGRHNYANALACLALGDAMGLALPVMLASLRDYPGLPHRSELIASIDGVKYINDSKATNTGATIAALQGLSADNNIVLIAGGQGKGANFGELAEPVVDACRAVILFGEDAGLIEQALGDTIALHRVTDLEQALHTARELAQPGDLVLLSPACASFDMFSSFGDRGDQFAALVRNMAGEGER